MTMISVTGKKGFSLVELLVAVAVLSIGIITVLETLSFSGRVAGISSDITDALFLAEDKLQELEFKEGRELIQQEPPETGGKREKFNWQQRIIPTPDLGLYRLNFRIFWQRLNRQEEFSIDTYLR